MIAGSLAAAHEARRHFEDRLAFECDAWDVHEDLRTGARGLIVLDARTSKAFEAGHVPGSVNVPHREIGPGLEDRIPKSLLIVTYCDGFHCNASTKAAARLAALGYRVKEMRDGLRGWRAEGFPVETGPGPHGRTRLRATA